MVAAEILHQKETSNTLANVQKDTNTWVRRRMETEDFESNDDVEKFLAHRVKENTSTKVTIPTPLTPSIYSKRASKRQMAEEADSVMEKLGGKAEDELDVFVSLSNYATALIYMIWRKQN
ncbi:hypothetical protein AVEN_31273-1 [Araneus ventricosus]|uniref:Uncharacterized protein n=1 Tax=Araneus ventricosus TaxID=182803 RepID=A0A4Y2VED2_ARAVE|nr:hypothetical protein AVEN_31273-1 [Araneus ventricosus]